MKAICFLQVMVVSTALAQGAVLYDVIDLGYGPYPTDVGDSGQVLFTQFVLVPDGAGHYVRWNFPALSADEMNTWNQIVGHRSYQSYIWTPDGMGGYTATRVDLEWAFGINDACEVAGCFPVGGYYHPYIWTPEGGGTRVHLGTLGGEGGYALDINNRGEVCGYSWLANDEVHAFYWTAAEGMLDIGTLGGVESHAMQINDWGQVTGSAFGPENKYHAFVWSREKGMIDVGVMEGSTDVAKSYGQDINNLGQVVGTAFDRNNMPRGFVWTEKRGLMDLNTVVDPALRVSFSRGVGNNNPGQIVAEGTTAQGARTVFLLNPRDTQGPVVTCAPMPLLWPPNHRLLPFSLTNFIVSVVDATDGPLTVSDSCRIVSIYSDELEDARGQGDGSTLGDIVMLNGSDFMVRAERAMPGNGRVYGVVVEAVDSMGNTTTVIWRIGVPANPGKQEPVDDGPGTGYTVDAD